MEGVKNYQKGTTSSIAGVSLLRKSSRNTKGIFGSESPNTAVGKYFKILIQVLLFLSNLRFFVL